MNKELDKINSFIGQNKKMPEFKKVDGIILYGSFLKGKKYNDIDLCYFFNNTKKEQFEFRKKLLSKAPENFDIQIYGLLPVYLQVEILKGKVIYHSKHRDKLYAAALKTIKEYEFFKRRYLDYISKGKIIV